MSPDAGRLTRLTGSVKYYLRATWKKYKALPIRGKLAIWLLALFYVLMTAIILIATPARIGQALYDFAQELSHLRFGWLVFVGIITIVSIPPMLGHTTSLILCGFAYGLPGFILAAGASVFAAATVFIFLRLLFRARLRVWSSKNEKWQALEAVIREKGLPLICFIRMSPLPPWPYSNALFASIEAVKLWQFIIAQTFVFPKIFISVFIGSRAAALADGDQRGKMDKWTKVINSGLILAGMMAGAITSWVIYRQMQHHIRHLEGVPPEIDELAAEAIEEADEEAPLLRHQMSDPVGAVEAQTRLG